LVRVVVTGAALGLGAGMMPFGIVTVGAPAAGASSSCTGTKVVTCTFNSTGSLQTFVVPSGVSHVTIDSKGAQGGSGFGPGVGGEGAEVSGTLPAMCRSTLNIVVGGQGTVVDDRGGGGGGSFVYSGTGSSIVLIVAAAGGGGALGNSPGMPGSSTQTATGQGGTAGGTNGGGGGAGSFIDGGGGGAGAFGNGADAGSFPSAQGGFDLANGGAGGAGIAGFGNGGFGGGGGTGESGGGGGGGYNGGGGAEGLIDAGGGGGGSFITSNATGITLTDGDNTGDGVVTISYTLNQNGNSQGQDCDIEGQNQG
jgi:hypothetical protein